MRLDEIIIVNSNQVFDRPGDVTVYKNARSACRDVERLDIEGDSLHVLSAKGTRLSFTLNGLDIILEASGDAADYSAVARSWLIAAAAHASNRPSSSLTHESLESLISIVGVR